jgi:hypothetical protein
MSEEIIREASNSYDKSISRKPVSAYQQLSGILNAYKTEEVSLNEALRKLQLKENRILRPYCKVTSNGAIALHGISKQPIVLYVEQWEKVGKLVKNNYLDNYIKYNENRVKRRRPRVEKESDDHVEEDEVVEDTI